jgi:hypothetical protein
MASRFNSGPFRDEFLIAFRHLPMSRALHNVPQIHWNRAVSTYIDRNFPDEAENFVEDFQIDRNGRIVYFPTDDPNASPETFEFLGNFDLLELFGYINAQIWRKNEKQTVERLLQWMAIDEETRQNIKDYFGI